MNWGVFSENEFFERLCDLLEGRKDSKEELIRFLDQYSNLPPRVKCVRESLDSPAKADSLPHRLKTIRSAQARILHRVLMVGVGRIVFDDVVEWKVKDQNTGEVETDGIGAGLPYDSDAVSHIVGVILDMSASTVDKSKPRRTDTMSRIAVKQFGLPYWRNSGGPAESGQIERKVEEFLDKHGVVSLPTDFEGILETPLFETVL